jgi:DNA-binding XRE family transcriptional regulator
LEELDIGQGCASPFLECDRGCCTGADATKRNSEYSPWDYLRNRISIGLLVQPRKRDRKQRQPAIGPERAFGQALREIRRSREISQEKLGLDAGFDRTYISLIERGINSPTIRTVVRLAKVLNVPASKIVLKMEQFLTPPTTN